MKNNNDDKRKITSVESDFICWYASIQTKGYKSKVSIDNLLSKTDVVSNSVKNKENRFIVDLLPYSILAVLNVNFRSNNEVDDSVYFEIMNLTTNKKEFVIIDKISGEVIKSPIDKDNLNIYSLIYELEQIDTYEYKELLKCVYNYKNDFILREKILELIAIKILFNYSNRRRGYKRAIKFLENVSKQVPGISYSGSSIDNIMNDYKSKIKKLVY